MTSNLKTQPNDKQIAALKEFAKVHGRNWKSVLRKAWETGNYTGIKPYGDTAAYLQQIRNTYGPSWLARFVLAKDGVSYAVFSAKERVPVQCAWFSYCENAATGTTPHPFLGEVATCDRCHKFATGKDRTPAAPAAPAEEPIRISANSPFVGGGNSWAPEVIADNSGKWVGNALRFATREEAQANVENLMYRWTLVREIRVVESNDPPNYRWIPGKGLEAIK